MINKAFLTAFLIKTAVMALGILLAWNGAIAPLLGLPEMTYFQALLLVVAWAIMSVKIHIGGDRIGGTQ